MGGLDAVYPGKTIQHQYPAGLFFQQKFLILKLPCCY